MLLTDPPRIGLAIVSTRLVDTSEEEGEGEEGGEERGGGEEIESRAEVLVEDFACEGLVLDINYAILSSQLYYIYLQNIFNTT